jgi:DNA invertase Pin-like site-specific DNA recombinase
LSEKIDAGSASGKLQFHVFAALAEFKRNLVNERTLAGLAAARTRDRVGGGAQAQAERQADLGNQGNAGRSGRAGQRHYRRFGVSRATLYKRVGVVQSVNLA